MRAVCVNLPGGLENISIAEIEEPRAGPGQVLVQVVYAACNWGDIQKRQGTYPDPMTYPLFLGAEASGLVEAVGKGVSGLEPGQPVALISGIDMLRAFAEKLVVAAELVIPLPAAFDLRQAAVIPIAALTAFHLLHTAHKIRPGEAVLVHSVSGSVGLALAQLARDAGATVYGTVGTADKIAQAMSFGAEMVIARDSEDFVEHVLHKTGGKGVDLVIDSLGADILERSFDVLRPFGRLINIGEAAGEPDFPIRKTLYRRSTSMAGFELMHAAPGSRQWRRGVRHVMAALAEGRFDMPIAAEFELDDAARAQAFLESRRSTGKVVLRIGVG
ncbi:quinone oxidoreductase family protein [Mesorhizobium sp. A623]